MTTGTPIVPRWEWRVFGDDFSDLDARLAAEGATSSTSTEIYIVAGRDDVNVKIRGGQLDVKRRLRVDRGLELWAPVLKAAFPIDAAAIARIFDYWQIPAPPLSAEHYSAEAFLDDVVTPCTGLRIARVGKARRQAPIAGCMVELARLDVDGQAVQTAAIESERPDEVLYLSRALGLDARDNASYVAALRRLLPVPTRARGRPGRGPV